MSSFKAGKIVSYKRGKILLRSLKRKDSVQVIKEERVSSYKRGKILVKL